MGPDGLRTKAGAGPALVVGVVTLVLVALGVALAVTGGETDSKAGASVLPRLTAVVPTTEVLTTPPPEPSATPTPVEPAEPTPSPSSTPTPTPSAEAAPASVATDETSAAAVTPEPLPTIVVTPATPLPTPSSTPTPEPAAEPEVLSAAPAATAALPPPEPTASPTPVPTPEPTPTPTPEPTPAPSPPADGGAEATLVAATNAVRQAAGLNPLAVDPGLTAHARWWSGQMAASGSMAHSGGVPWPNWAENVGYAFGSAMTVFDLWTVSPGHYDNMLHPGVTHVGVGVVVAPDGTIWVTQVLAG